MCIRDRATAMRGANPWLLYLLPVGGLAIVGVYKLYRVSGVGTNEVFYTLVSMVYGPVVKWHSTISGILPSSATTVLYLSLIHICP